MFRLTIIALMAGLLGFAVFGGLERSMVYPFDPTRTEPPDGLTETTLATGDGETLVVWTAPPDDGKPVILYFHGNAGNLRLRSPRFGAFTATGLGLVAAGYRGSSGSTGEPTEPTLIADAIELADAVAELAGPGPVIYYGESLGAAVAIALAVERPPAALVLEAPFASLAAMAVALHGRDTLARLADSQWKSVERIAEVTAPLLILHGEHDRLVPPEQGRAVFEAAASPDKHFELVTGAGHNDVWQPDAQYHMHAFLDRF